MRIYKIILLSFISVLLFGACSDDDKVKEGNPQMNITGEYGTAMFADSLAFTVDVVDEVPLSTLKVRLYFDTEVVTEEVIRTKENGTYSGKIYVPYYADTPNGTAKLEFVLQNISLTKEIKEFDVNISRPNYEAIYFVTEDGELKLDKVSDYQYELTDEFPREVSGYFRAPAMGANGNEMTFGMEDGKIKEGSTSPITFTHFIQEWTMEFNTKSYEAAPFQVAYMLNGEQFTQVAGDKDRFGIDIELEQDGDVEITGIDGFADWWVDTDFLTRVDNTKFTFNGITGKYRVMVDFNKQYTIFEVMDGDELATFNDDGTGAIWVIGTDVAKPNLDDGDIGWEPNNAICLVPIADKVHQLTLVGGKSISTESINFKFFYQKGWGGEFSPDVATVVKGDDLIFMGDGETKDSGNFGLVEGVELEDGATYVFTVDFTEEGESGKISFEKR